MQKLSAFLFKLIAWVVGIYSWFYLCVESQTSPREAASRALQWEHTKVTRFEVISLLILVAFLAVVSFIERIWKFIFKAPMQRLLKKFGPYGFVRAEWGKGLAARKDLWTDFTLDGRHLVETVKREMFEAKKTGAVIRANFRELNLPQMFPDSKFLKLTFPNGRYVEIKEGDSIDFPANLTVYAGDPSRALTPEQIATPKLEKQEPEDRPIIPSIAGAWKDAEGAITRITQDGDKWTGKCSYKLKDGTLVESEISGTIGLDRKIRGTLYHTNCPPDWEVKQDHESEVSEDGNKINGTAIWKGGARNYTWSRNVQTDSSAVFVPSEKRVSTPENSYRILTDAQRASIKDALSEFAPQQFQVLQVGFGDNQAAHFAQLIHKCMIDDCGWCGGISLHLDASEQGIKIHSGIGVMLSQEDSNRSDRMREIRKRAMKIFAIAGIPVSDRFAKEAIHPTPVGIVEIVVAAKP